MTAIKIDSVGDIYVFMHSYVCITIIFKEYDTFCKNDTT